MKKAGKIADHSQGNIEICPNASFCEDLMTGPYIFTFADILYRSSIYSLFNWPVQAVSRKNSIYIFHFISVAGGWPGWLWEMDWRISVVDRKQLKDRSARPSLSTDSLSCNACELASLYFQPTFPCSFTGSLVKYGTNTALGKLHVLQNYVFLDQNYWFDKFFI